LHSTITPANHTNLQQAAIDGLIKIYWSRERSPPSTRTAQRLSRCVLMSYTVFVRGSGKSSIATELERAFFNLGRQVYVLDGTTFVPAWAHDWDYSLKIGRENLSRRVGEVRKCRDAELLLSRHLFRPTGDRTNSSAT